MACGCPVVATDLPAVKELITHRQTGYLVRPERPAELARSIRMLLEQQSFTKQLSENALTLLKNNFLWDQKNKELRLLYSSLTKISSYV